MRIALLSESYLPHTDGVAHMMARVVDELQKKHEILVITLDEKESVETNGVTVHRLKGTPLRAYPKCKYRVRPPYGKILKILGDFEPDVIHTQTSLTLGAAGKHAANEMGIPIVSTFHTDLEGFATEIIRQGNLKVNPLTRAALSSRFGKKLALKIIDRFSHPILYSYLNVVDAVTSPSDPITELLIGKGVSEERIRKVPNPIELNPDSISGEEFRDKWGVEGFMVLHVGRLSWEKRIDKILETAARVKDATFVITSEGPLGDDLKNAAARMGLDNVKFTGYLPYKELYGAYHASDCFLAASPYETFNISAAQALSFGKPIIGVKRLGLMEFIKHGKNGFLVELNDKEISNYERYIRMLMGDAELKRSMGKKSRRIALRFEKRRVARKFLEVYKSAETNGFSEWKECRYLTALLAFVKAARI